MSSMFKSTVTTKRTRIDSLYLIKLPTSVLSHIIAHVGILDNIQVSRCSHLLHGVASRRESAPYVLGAKFMTYFSCQTHLDNVLTKCGRHTKLHLQVISDLLSDDIKQLTVNLCNILQLQKLELSVLYETDVSPICKLSSLTSLTLERSVIALRLGEANHMNQYPPGLLEYNGGYHIHSIELDRLPNTLTKLGAHYLLWQPSMSRFTSLVWLQLGNEMDREDFIGLTNTLTHLQTLRFFGLSEPLDHTTTVLFPHLTCLSDRSDRERDTVMAQSLPFLEMPKLRKLKTVTRFSPEFPMKLARFPLVTNLTLVGDVRAFMELIKPDALPASCTSLHLMDPTWDGICHSTASPLPTLDILASLVSPTDNVDNVLHTLVLDNDEQFHGTRALTWVGTLKIKDVITELQLDFVRLVPTVTRFRASRICQQSYSILLPSLHNLQHLQVIDTPMTVLNDIWMSQLHEFTENITDKSVVVHAFPSLCRFFVRNIRCHFHTTVVTNPNIDVIVNNCSPFRNENATVQLS